MYSIDSKIEGLKVKPSPKKHTENIFFLKQDDSDIKTDIVEKDKFVIDKTKEKKVDVENFLKLISNIGKNQDKPQTKIDEDKKSKEYSKTVKDDQEIKTKKSQPKSSVLIKIEKIKRLDKKIIIKQSQSYIGLDKTRKTEKPKGNIIDIDIPDTLRIGKTLYINRIPKPKPHVLIKAPDYYLNNREIFIDFISQLFSKYKQQIIQEESKADTVDVNKECNKSTGDDFSLLIHQKLVRDYINIYTPYRGLLLYHGLGSGKTCTSIAITEGLKYDKRVIIMTPASLRQNYVEELKKCGDYLYKKNQYWEFINIKKNPDMSKYLSKVLGLQHEYIVKNEGAWFINVKKDPNYDELTFEQQKSLDTQLDKMISNKYQFMNYNGLRMSHLQVMSKNFTINPFSNCVVVIDEAHNFISRIVNKLKRPKSLAIKLYNFLMMAENCRIIFLSGTPIINYPNEIAVLFNILRGYIKTYNFRLEYQLAGKLSKSKIQDILSKEEIYKYIDMLQYNESNNVLKITENPFNFITSKLNKNKVELDDKSTDPNLLIESIKSILIKQKINVQGNPIIESYLALPDNFDEFKQYFINSDNSIKNSDMFKMRIMGLTSYFRSVQEKLMPRYNENTDLKIIEIDMSDFQFGIYEEARVQERKIEDNNKKKQMKKKNKEDDIFNDSVSTYRIFSRAFCNYVFPRPDIKRPMPNDGQSIMDVIENPSLDQDVVEIPNPELIANDDEGKYEFDDMKDIKKDIDEKFDNTYEKRVQSALSTLEKNKLKYLSKDALATYSPKFLNILENISDDDYKGIHLLYSQFRTLEGVGIFKLVLDANGYSQFKIKKSGGEYVLNIQEEDIGKPMYALYTGTETTEEREIIKNVLNSAWKLVPASIVKEIFKLAPNNYMGEIIKLLMITASGAEGITLKNVRYVHITEPYWHPVRTRQVIGRARRICSHSELPNELRTVEVFMYIMKFSEKQLMSDSSIELRLKDKSKLDSKKVVSSDQLLYEICTIKDNINKSILDNVKESAIDCSIHSDSKMGENIKCFSIGNPKDNNYTYVPNIKDQSVDKIMEMNKKQETIKLREIEIAEIKYAYDPDEDKYKKNSYYIVYNYSEYTRGNLLQVGKLSKKPEGGYRFTKI